MRQRARDSAGPGSKALPKHSASEFGTSLVPTNADPKRAIERIACKVREITGCSSTEFADRIVAQVASALSWPKVGTDADEQVLSATAAISEMAPRNATEAMLATQMIAVHNAALMFMSRATLEDQYPSSIDTNVLRATRLMRLFVDQIEAMQKLKGRAGQQKVTVKHVHVHEGAQAIVGTVSVSGKGEGD